MLHTSLSRRTVVAGRLSATMLASMARAQQSAAVLIAVYAGQDVTLWDRVVAQPFNKDAPFKVEVFESPMPAVAVAQAGGSPPFNTALMNSAQAYDLHLKGLLTELTEADIPAIKAIPKSMWPTTRSGGILGVPVHFWLYVVAYNMELTKASDFESWNALLDKKWNKQVSLTDEASHSGARRPHLVLKDIRRRRYSMSCASVATISRCGRLTRAAPVRSRRSLPTSRRGFCVQGRTSVSRPMPW